MGLKIKPLRKKTNALFIDCILDNNIVYYILILCFLKKILFPLKLFYSILPKCYTIYNFLELNYSFFRLIIISFWLKFKINIIYNKTFGKIFFLNFKNKKNIFYENIFLKEIYFSSLIITPTRLNYLIYKKKKGYSKILETNFLKKTKIYILNLQSNIFFIKSFLKEEIFYKNSSINVYINNTTIFILIKKCIYYLVKSIIPFLGIGIVKKKLINKTRSYYFRFFDKNFQNLILLWLNEIIISENLKPSLQHKWGVRKKGRLNKYRIYKTVVNSYLIISTLFRHIFYTFVFLISLLLFLEILDIYIYLRY